MHTALVLATLLSQTPALSSSPRTLDLRLQPQPPRAPGGATLLAPAPLAETPRVPVTPWVRIPTMALSGLVLGSAAAVGGFVALPNTSNEGPTTGPLIGGGAGAFLGASGGVWGASRLMGGQGSYLGTALGTLAGAGAGLLLIGGGALTGSDAVIGTAVCVGATMPVVGAILGHEWSAPAAPKTFQVMPSLAVGASGVQAGLSGQF